MNDRPTLPRGLRYWLAVLAAVGALVVSFLTLDSEIVPSQFALVAALSVLAAVLMWWNSAGMPLKYRTRSAAHIVLFLGMIMLPLRGVLPPDILAYMTFFSVSCIVLFFVLLWRAWRMGRQTVRDRQPTLRVRK